VNGPITLEDAGDEDIAQAINQLNQFVTKLEEENRQQRERINDLEQQIKRLKGGDQPSEHLKVVDSDRGKLSVPASHIMAETKRGPKHDGLPTGEAMEVLKQQGYDRSRQAVLNFMKSVAEEVERIKYLSSHDNKNSRNCSRLVWND
jgi:TolA-binding protein